MAGPAAHHNLTAVIFRRRIYTGCIMRVTAAQREHNRASLLLVGLELFAQQGFAATTVDQVARAAGVAKGTFYNYFANKEDLALAAFVEALEDVEGRLGELRGLPSVQERLAVLFAHFGRWAVHPELIWVWGVENLRRGRGEPASALLRRLLKVLFADAQARGEVRGDRAAGLLALDLEGIVLAHIAVWYHDGADGDLLAALQEATVAYIHGQRPDTGRARSSRRSDEPGI